jgi:pimeloyl-ACP methyl ester carboxylesterase
MKDDKISAFRIHVGQEVLSDLLQRLKRTRWSDEVKGAGWDHGTNLEYLKDLVDHWQHRYDWRKHEAELNEFAHFKADIGGVNIHFIHERGKGPSPTPIILTHGWPDSFHRFHKIITRLTDPAKYGGKAEDSFDVVVPSIPGFGFSDRKPVSCSAVADLWVKLMSALGYTHFVAAGADAGAIVTKQLALRHPKQLTAIHLTDVGYPTGQEDPSTMGKAEQKFSEFIKKWWMKEGAYSMLQATKPQTLAYELNDSPAGLASWMASMIKTGADGDKVDEAFGSRDELLTNLMIYWATQTAGSAAHFFAAEAKAAYGAQAPGPQRSEAPAAIALFPREAPCPREWAERSLNVQRFTKMPRGGHFAALEEPEMYAQDLHESFSELVTPIASIDKRSPPSRQPNER